MKNNMPIQIKPGYLVAIQDNMGANGRVFNTIVLTNKEGAIYCTDGEYRFNLNCFNNPDMEGSEWHKGLNIVYVWGYPKNIERLCCYENTNERPLIWKRNYYKKMTKSQIEEVLGYKIEIVEE